MKPPAALPSLADRQAFRALELQRTGTVPPGRVMFCQGRKILHYGDVAKLRDRLNIPKGADILCVALEDADDIKGWING